MKIHLYEIEKRNVDNLGFVKINCRKLEKVENIFGIPNGKSEFLSTNCANFSLLHAAVLELLERDEGYTIFFKSGDKAQVKILMRLEFINQIIYLAIDYRQLGKEILF